MALWTTSVDIAFPRDCAVTSVAHRARSVAERSSCFNLGLYYPRALYSQDCHGRQRRGGLARSTVSFGRESGRQLQAWTGDEDNSPSDGVLQAQVHRNRTLHLGNVNVPPSRSAIEGRKRGHP